MNPPIHRMIRSLFVALSLSQVHAQTRTSVSYRMTTETMDSGGGLSHSTAYSNISSSNSQTGGISANGQLRQATAYIAQLGDISDSTVLPPGFSTWAVAAGLAGPAAALGAIPFGDGVPNLLKFAFNMNGAGPDVSILVRGSGLSGLPLVISEPQQPGGSHSRILRIEYLRRKNSGLVFTPEFSSDLSASGPGGWAPAAGTPQVSSIDSEWERVVIYDEAPAGRRFGRVRVELPIAGN